ncbi:MAG: TauD/TfdA family dioxygenase [Pseudomonadota bacterium]
MTYQTIEVSTLTPHIGAEVSGVDLSQPLNEIQMGELKQAFLKHMVLVFRDQHLTQEQHKNFGRLFGPLHVHPVKHAQGGDPELLKVKTTARSKYTAGDGWHTDVTCDEKPPMGSMLYITDIPEVGGGDTMFADMYLAYELLSESMQQFLEGLTAIHDGSIPYVQGFGIQAQGNAEYPKNEHPVVTRHPETGRKVLYVNSTFTSHIVQLSRAESRVILDFLNNHIATTLSLTCRVQWEPNTLTFWDNRCTQHHAVWDYYPHTRYGERVSIIGKRPAV